ncbi:proline dehydrogenase family protein [Paenibacillus sp. MER 99-2]|uniref:proline dehydrogenase family protein n=1 Tax=Paenibacillus sp. MER 99-2 TaxID=2939572 RepID=UPI00203C4F04|nr:proline dehydrogenase family protein [Paenibacillus sp. MER 99-2]MCM3174370.1 proline dehydrogenase family protein [Paenibacillus sp. MER 99-2]
MSIGTEMYRKTLLTVAGNKTVENLSVKYGKKLAGKFIAGNTLEEALEEIRILNNKGIMATLDHLGEGITRLSEAALYRDEYLRLVDGIAREQADSNVSLKPTQMGLALDPEEGYENIRAVAAQAKLHDLFVRIDMEDSPFTQATLDIVRRLHGEGLVNTGTVLQAYLHRTVEDTRDMIREGIRLRLVKGAYKEPATVAYQNASEVIEQFKLMIRHHLDQGVYTAVASHDDHIISWTKQYAKDRGISPDAYEFQMLYGLRMSEQERLAQEGYRIRCYVPYGTMWYPYYTRRLAEKPANLWMVVKNMFR